MNKLTADEIRTMLEQLDHIQVLTDAMRRQVRAPTGDELYPAAGAVGMIRDKLLTASLSDVEVGSVASGAESISALPPSQSVPAPGDEE